MASKSKGIADFLPTKDSTKPNYLQAKIDPALYAQVRAKMKETGLTWDELVTALFKYYLDSDGTKTK